MGTYVSNYAEAVELSRQLRLRTIPEAPPPPARPQSKIHHNARYRVATAWHLDRQNATQLIAAQQTAARQPMLSEGRRRSSRTMTKNAGLVFAYLVRLTVKHGRCKTSIRDIGKRTECSRRTVFNALDQLERTGWITREPTRVRVRSSRQIIDRQDVNSYVVHHPKSALGPAVP